MDVTSFSFYKFSQSAFDIFLGLNTSFFMISRIKFNHWCKNPLDCILPIFDTFLYSCL